MHLTSNYNLKKPETTDIYDIGNENDNMDIIDAALANTNGNVAPIELTSTASQAYAVGAQLIYNGLLYKVDSAIALGDTLVVGGNISLSPKITSQLATLNTQLTSLDNLHLTYCSDGSQYLGESINFDDNFTLLRKNGKVIEFQLRTASGQAVGTTQIKVASLPEGYRPRKGTIINAIGMNSDGSADIAYGHALILTNGDVYMQMSTECYYASFHVTFLITGDESN